MADDNSNRPEGLNDDEWRLVRSFRCMNKDERNSTLVESGQRLMKRFSVTPFEGELDTIDELLAEDVCAETVEDCADRLVRAAPSCDGEVLCWDDVGDPLRFKREALGGVWETSLGTSETDTDTAEYLSCAYLGWLGVHNWARHPRHSRSQEEVDDSLQHDFLAYLVQWREQILRTIEKQVEATDQGEGGTALSAIYLPHSDTHTEPQRLQVRNENNTTLVIRIPLKEPQTSKSGKTLTVASTQGFVPTPAKVDDKSVHLEVHAYINR